MTMTMTHLKDVLHDATEYDVELLLQMTIGAGSVDPRLIEPDHDEPDVEELVAFRCSTVS
jgi:hypothetical protein